MSLISAKTSAGGLLTSAERLTSRMAALSHGLRYGQRLRITPSDRREPQGALRLFHRGALRGGARARGLGGQGDARRARPAEGGVRLPARRRGVPDRRTPLAAAGGLYAHHARPGAHPQTAAESQRAAGTDRRGGAARLHAGAARAILEERPREAAGRPRQGQEAARQARRGEGSRLAARQGAHAAARLTHSGASFGFFMS